MATKDFIEKIAPLVQHYAPAYGIAVCSPIIAQAVLESAGGTSNKAVVGHNYFGLKYRADRVPVACGKFKDGSAEQNKDGTYTNITDEWFRFRSMEEGVIGYFQFINCAAYTGLKGVTNPKEYLEIIKAAGYATSIDYVEKVMSVVDAYGLRRYDSKMEEKKEDVKTMRINIHAGHNPDGKPACGAVGFIKESTENRKVKDAVISQLRKLGHTVYDCTCEDGLNSSDNLARIVKACNAHNVDLDISIHFNAGAKDAVGNGQTTGVEVYTYDTDGIAKKCAERLCAEIAGLGFKNRGAKINKDFYVLRRTVAPAILIECCFVDDKDDVQLYDCQKMADAIVRGIAGRNADIADDVLTETDAAAPGAETVAGSSEKLYRVQVGAYSIKGNADAMRNRLQEAGFDAIIVSA